MAGDDLAVIGRHHRRRPAILDERGGDLDDLILGVGAGVPRIRLQPRKRPLFDLLGAKAKGHEVILAGDGCLDAAG